ncbi:MAG: hypothetical protein WCO78_00950 [Candidatus Roizmanbacteria bacterium]
MRQLSSVNNHHRLGVLRGSVPHLGSFWSLARQLVLLAAIPLLFILDYAYFTLARPGCPACANFDGFLRTASLTTAYISNHAALPTFINQFRS